ncbi:Radial spoke head 10 -like protein B [Channa argus]|uniref:Radial spoke head 10-like protein B n=1 Tax=Channa argus TaxID=215402 RepID=A0A6G1QRA1_CHAAH|nr:Radial spoke head 10 -like protein B [Channa argus]
MGEKEKKNALIDDKQEIKTTCGIPELLKMTEEGENRKLLSRSASLSVDPANVEDDRTRLQDHPVINEQVDNDRIDEHSTVSYLLVQRYEGETSEGQLHGEGVAFFEGGHIYKGAFSRGLMDGLGIFTWSNGLKYEGEFVCNTPMGKGTYIWPDGSSYNGDVYKGMRHGSGTYKCAKPFVSYKGQWDFGKRHGKGIVYYNQNQTSWYKGDWVKNNREGWGVRCYPSGNIYYGEWKNNHRHGQGTMKWLRLGQQYDGEWMDGVQHGRGTHVWILRRANESKYYQNNQYRGDFVLGQRHGQGTFYYAGGAVYEGEWKNNQKHGKDGHVLNGECVDDQMMAPSFYRNRAPTSLCVASSLTDRDSSTLGPNVALNIDCLLDKIPERKRNNEYKQVEAVLLQLDTKLKSIYSFYSSLGHAHSPYNTSLLSRLQLWRLLKDCKIHHHGITLTQIDHLIKEGTATEIHSPFTPILFHRLISCLVIVAYHIYNKELESQKNLLAACLSKLMTDDILPNAKKITFLEFFEVILGCAEVKCKQDSEELEKDQSLSNPCPTLKTANSSSQSVRFFLSLS